MGFITNNREQISFIGYSLDDFVSQGAKCRFILELVSELNLRTLYEQYSDQGNDAFDPAAMLAAWFFAYSEGVTSTQKLEARCQRDLHYIYASSSPKRSKDTESLSRYLSEIRKDIAEYMQHCDLWDENDDISALEAVREKVSRLQQLEKTLTERHEPLQNRRGELKAEYRDAHKINITEPDAIMMDKVNGKKKVPAYNAQISIDTETHLICANDVVQDRNDQNQFSRQHEKVEHTVGADTERAYIADAGYHSLEQLEYIESNQIDAVVADPQPEKH